MAAVLASQVPIARGRFSQTPASFGNLLPLSGAVARVSPSPEFKSLRDDARITMRQLATELRYLGVEIEFRGTEILRCGSLEKAAMALHSLLIFPAMENGVLTGDSDDCAIFLDSKGKRYLAAFGPEGVEIFRTGRELEFAKLSFENVETRKLAACGVVLEVTRSHLANISIGMKSIGVGRDLIIDGIENLLNPILGYYELERLMRNGRGKHINRAGE